jgi:DNA-directed RNA polymerase subunit M/transcription elongation factor TFIIS
MSFSSKDHSDFRLNSTNGIEELERNSCLPMATKNSLCSKEANAQNRYNISSDSNDDEIADINTKERENLKDIEQYHKYQQDTQDNTPWASSSDVRIVDSDKLPDPNPIMDTEGCPECGNVQAYWWIVQTDSADEASAQFFRCTKCNHTWRTPSSSL